MPPLGSEVRQFTYGDNTVTEENGRCTTADGVLAGTAVSIAQAANKFASWLDADIAEILPLVTSTPAKLLGIDNQYGEIRAGGIANLVLADSLLNIEHTIVQGDLSALR
jgi:N-acetylglucosamine-6-phosphate deacetylase